MSDQSKTLAEIFRRIREHSLKLDGDIIYHSTALEQLVAKAKQVNFFTIFAQTLCEGKAISLDAFMSEVEKHLIIVALTECGFIQAQAANVLGISERSMWHRIKKLGIDVAALKKANEKGDAREPPP